MVHTEPVGMRRRAPRGWQVRGGYARLCAAVVMAKVRANRGRMSPARVLSSESACYSSPLLWG
jgi:hypothetical protein